MITVNQLNYTYPGSNVQAIKNLSFEVQKGEIFGFLGPSGAGKSTTQKILIRLLSGYSGSIQIMDKGLDTWSSDFYEHIGVGFELPNHYLKLTAIENLKFFASFYGQRPKDTLKLLDMVGLANEADKKVASYSKGMKMRLNFVRSFMHNPDVLFLDEPTSGLDPANARNIKDIIKDLRSQGKTIFLTTHNMHDADELCDRVAFIADGEIKAIDSPKNLKLANGTRKVMVEIDGYTKEFPMDSLGQNAEFLELIRNNNLKSIHSTEATLEDIFIKVTGYKLMS